MALTEAEELELLELEEAEQSKQNAAQKKDLLAEIVNATKRSSLAAKAPATLFNALKHDPKQVFEKGGGMAIPVAGAALGGPIGAAGGEALRQFIGTAIGSKDVPESALGRFASVATSGASANRIAGPVMAKAGEVLAPVAKSAGKFGSKLGEMITGVPARQFGRLANDPGALFIPKTIGQAGDEFGASLKKLGINIEKTPDEINDPQLAVARRTAKNFFERMETGVPKTVNKTIKVKKPSGIVDAKGVPLQTEVDEIVSKTVHEPFRPNAGEILKARRATDREIAGTSWKDKEGLHGLYKQRGKLNEMFENVSGEGAEASRKYARSALAAQFRKLLPETQTGKMSFVKSVALPLLARSALTPLVSAPLTAGLLTAGGSVAAKGASKVAQNEQARLVLAQLIASMGSGK